MQQHLTYGLNLAVPLFIWIGLAVAVDADGTGGTTAKPVLPAPLQVTLTRRRHNGAYGTSAYSFRHATQQLTEHRNYVDLVFNNCGLLHIRPHGDLTSDIVDLGAMSLADAEGRVPPMSQVGWHHESIQPELGHVYFQQIEDGRQSFSLWFRILKITPDALTLEWRPTDPARTLLALETGRGAAGTMGLCGGSHTAD